MFEAYQTSMHQLITSIPKIKQSAKTELASIQSSFKNSIDFMREQCNDTGVNVTQGKKVQRQHRYEKLKQEFTNLIEKVGSMNELAQPLSTMTMSKENSNKDGAAATIKEL